MSKNPRQTVYPKIHVLNTIRLLAITQKERPNIPKRVAICRGKRCPVKAIPTGLNERPEKSSNSKKWKNTSGTKKDEQPIKPIQGYFQDPRKTPKERQNVRLRDRTETCPLPCPGSPFTTPNLPKNIIRK